MNLQELLTDENCNEQLSDEDFEKQFMFDMNRTESIAYFKYLKDESEIFSDPII